MIIKDVKDEDMVGHRQNGSMLTVGDVAQLLNVHVNTVRRWSNQGIIRAYRIGPRADRRFWREDITRLLGEFRAKKERLNEQNR